MNARAPYQYFFYTPFGETILQEDAFNDSCDFNDSREGSTASYEGSARSADLDPEPSEASSRTPLRNKTRGEQTGNYYYGARYYNPKWSIWLSVDQLAHKYPSMSPFVFTGNNPIILVDPDGREIDISGLLGSTDHIQAFVLFAKSKEGKEFLDMYASDGQELSYKGEVFYKANEAGFYHKEGVDLSYSIKDNNSAGSGTALKYLNNRLLVSINISKVPFGTDDRIFNIVSHIGHESFMHGNLTAEDGLDDGKKNSSNIPSDYKHVSYFHHQHNYQTFNYPANPRARDFEKKMINLLDFANNELNCGFTQKHIKRNIWNFWGSYPLEKGLVD